jgi:hypothetical protein
VYDCSAAWVIRELNGACAVPHCGLQRAKRALQRRKGVQRALGEWVAIFSYAKDRTLTRTVHYNGDMQKLRDAYAGCGGLQEELVVCSVDVWRVAEVVGVPG